MNLDSKPAPWSKIGRIALIVTLHLLMLQWVQRVWFNSVRYSQSAAEQTEVMLLPPPVPAQQMRDKPKTEQPTAIKFEHIFRVPPPTLSMPDLPPVQAPEEPQQSATTPSGGAKEAPAPTRGEGNPGNAGNGLGSEGLPKIMYAKVDYEVPPEIDYPRMSRCNGEQGQVILRVLISSTGIATAADIQTSSGYHLLDEEARRGVMEARYKPFKEKGIPISVYALAPITFALPPQSIPKHGGLGQHRDRDCI